MQGAWEKGKYRGQIDLTEIVGVDHETKDKIAVQVSSKSWPVFETMMAAAASDSVEIRVSSGFRDYREQESLKKVQKNGGAQAASPGNSNHQHGQAYDVTTGMPKGNPTGSPAKWTDEYRWLVLNAWRFGFKREVQTEAWHWEYRPTEVSESTDNFESLTLLKAYMKRNPKFLPYPTYKPPQESSKPPVPAGGPRDH